MTEQFSLEERELATWLEEDFEDNLCRIENSGKNNNHHEDQTEAWFFLARDLLKKQKEEKEKQIELLCNEYRNDWDDGFIWSPDVFKYKLKSHFLDASVVAGIVKDEAFVATENDSISKSPCGTDDASVATCKHCNEPITYYSTIWFHKSKSNNGYWCDPNERYTSHAELKGD